MPPAEEIAAQTAAINRLIRQGHYALRRMLDASTAAAASKAEIKAEAAAAPRRHNSTRRAHRETFRLVPERQVSQPRMRQYWRSVGLDFEVPKPGRANNSKNNR
jgi:hypothetical protein